MENELKKLKVALEAAVVSVTCRRPVTASNRGEEVPVDLASREAGMEADAAARLLRELSAAVEGVEYALHSLGHGYCHAQFRAEQHLLLGTAALKRAEWFVSQTNHYQRGEVTFNDVT
jgi:hypothetical protein